jgi:glycosyltransferase involved in cell wall biosynthesis
MGIDDARVRVVPSGVDLSRFSPLGTPPRSRRARPRVLSLSRLVERKGVGNVVEAIAKLPDVELLIAGGPPAALLEDEPEAARIVALTERLGVADRVRVLGAVRREDVPDLIRSVDVVACCPWYEPFGIVAVEALACGVPVVASRVGGLAETVQHGVTGLHVAPRAPREIANALATLLADDALRRRMGRAGVRRARRYAWPRVTGEIYDVLAELCEEARFTAVPRHPEVVHR